MDLSVEEENPAWEFGFRWLKECYMDGIKRIGAKQRVIYCRKRYKFGIMKSCNGLAILRELLGEKRVFSRNFKRKRLIFRGSFSLCFLRDLRENGMTI